MKILLASMFAAAAFGAFCGAMSERAQHRERQEYSRGYRDGYYAPHVAPLHPVVENLLCKYAELACQPMKGKR